MDFSQSDFSRHLTQLPLKYQHLINSLHRWSLYCPLYLDMNWPLGGTICKECLHLINRSLQLYFRFAFVFFFMPHCCHTASLHNLPFTLNGNSTGKEYIHATATLQPGRTGLGNIQSHRHAQSKPREKKPC